ncbi:MAG TPA: hypothetical protein VGR71_14900, partial [Nitrospira sp.]|nr:hypothetical protein [Nitrospira sp.]
DALLIEILLGAVYQQSLEYRHRPQLRRFLAVVSDIYDSFLSEDRRTQAGVPLAERTAPLAAFVFSGLSGPMTLPIDVVRSVCGAQIGVVSVPGSYADHPLLWSLVAHETASSVSNPNCPRIDILSTT